MRSKCCSNQFLQNFEVFRIVFHRTFKMILLVAVNQRQDQKNVLT